MTTPAQEGFIAAMLPTARKYEALTGFAAEGLIAINISETNWGAATSLFGIKGTGTAGSTNYTTWENYGPGAEHTVIQDNFALYKSIDDAYQGFFDFLSNNSRYATALAGFGMTRDWHELLHGINRAGYATDPGWADMIIALSGTVRNSQAFKEAPVVPVTPPADPTPQEVQAALTALSYFIFRGWDLGTLSTEDRRAIKFAASLVPEATT